MAPTEVLLLGDISKIAYSTLRTQPSGKLLKVHNAKQLCFASLTSYLVIKVRKRDDGLCINICHMEISYDTLAKCTHKISLEPY